MSILQRNQPFLRQLAALVAQNLGIRGQRATMPSAVNQSLSLHNDLGDLTRAEANAIIDRSCGDVVSPSVGLSIWNTNSMTSSGWWFNYMFLFTLYILIDICFPHLDSFDI